MKNLQKDKIIKTKPNKELLDALKEGEVILKELNEGKREGYNNMTDLINSLENE